MMRAIYTGVCASLLAGLLSSPAAAADVRASLQAALLCQGDPLATVRALAATGSKGFSSGYAATTFGEEMDEVDVIILREPLDIAGARTSAVILSMSTPYESFAGLVYGRFAGNYRTVIAKLGLVAAKAGDENAIGKFVKPLRRATNADPCPPTIALTPLANGEILLGCGWCNG
jgi:hypothetical protein